MPITEILQKNADFYPTDTALIEINPQNEGKKRLTWQEYSLIESNPNEAYRKEISWGEFNKAANRFANLLLSRGIKKGDKVAILLMNCIEWLPIYFGILKTGAMAVPLNYRYAADEIKYCLELADADVIIFGPEFTGRVEQICSRVKRIKMWLYL
ncbi:MAG: class I adenylate-forming enzyme family protein, partial [Acutalibacteraceae bacterium]|nr:class I adenylate-forming enzyme family protein [Acutalibacteraceae bacterium]